MFQSSLFGLREFSCMFRLIEEPKKEKKPIDETRELGFMLYDMDFTDINNPMPAFFRAKIDNGVIVIPLWDSEEVRK